MLSLSQSAKATSVSKATVHRAIKSGKLSATRNEDGSYRIDPAELNRVYPFDMDNDSDETGETKPKRVSGHSNETIRNPQRNANETAVVEAELRDARELMRLLEKQLTDLRGDRDQWRETAYSAQRLLTTMTPDKFTTASSKRRWWHRKAI